MSNASNELDEQEQEIQNLQQTLTLVKKPRLIV